jgi:hypothetical protein
LRIAYFPFHRSFLFRKKIDGCQNKPSFAITQAIPSAATNHVNLQIEVRLQDETVWLSQAQLSEMSTVLYPLEKS